MKVKITGKLGEIGGSLSPWYENYIGACFDVAPLPKGSDSHNRGWVYEVVGGDNDKCGIQVHDCEIVKEPFFGLEEAYSQPVAASYDKTYYTRPATKVVAPSKKSAEQIVADAFNQQWGINLREDDIQRIIVAVQALKDLEK